MKTSLKTLMLAVALGALFAFAGTVQTVYSLANTNTAPTLATQGIPLNVNGLPVKSVSVTILNEPDGGNTNNFGFANAFAYAYDPAFKNPDGGESWVRVPLLDFVADAGTSINTQGYQLPLTQFSNENILPLSGRLYYRTTGGLNVDGTANRQRVVIKGEY